MRRARAATLGRRILLAAACAAMLACGGGHRETGQQLVVLGFDGMDWTYTQELIAAGRMPAFARLQREGTAAPLGTSVPPLSPIAWSNFTTGTDSGHHGIFDFLHRDPATYFPKSSLAEVEEGEPGPCFGKYRIPPTDEFETTRQGDPFWKPLEEDGVESWIFRMPIDFPPSGLATRELTGMGTPDLTGSLGEFSFFTSALFYDDVSSGGKVYPLDLWEDRAEGTLYGPENIFLCEPAKTETPLTIYFDPVEDVAKVVLGESETILAAGEWSDWVTVSFALHPLESVSASVRLYLRSVRPEVELYVSPLQIDPRNPATPISTPADFAALLAEETGGFYTQGMPEDTKAATEKLFSIDEYLVQARITAEEIEKQFGWALDHFEDGMLFYYFGNTDLVSHIMWGRTDPEHPLYDPAAAEKYAGVIPGLYERADELVAMALERLPEATLVVMSDHGFASWRRAMNLNSWLRDEGYLVLKDPSLAKDPGLFRNVDWSRSRAYGVGFNGLYVNQRGRERQGIVDPSAKDALLDEIGEKLLATVDPKTGGRAVTRVYPTARYFSHGRALAVGPDMIVGYAKGTRGSNDGALGELETEVFSDNTGQWTADHSMDHEAVPGILFTNRPLGRPAPTLTELAAVLVEEFGVEGFPAVTPGS
ncbi:MAG: alkaline phosphatase family protein [Acidobacteriota bacterium]|nr:alkaline phosphatase family protein [Acidobacteriota bacterium]MDH3525235.1 alkaline phosphatase family protein [Acidobacteriota bacterium]